MLVDKECFDDSTRELHFQHLLQYKNPISGGRLLRLMALRLYARCPVRMATFHRITAKDLKRALREGRTDGVYGVSISDHKTVMSCGDAIVFLHEAEWSVIEDVCILILQKSIMNDVVNLYINFHRSGIFSPRSKATKYRYFPRGRRPTIVGYTIRTPTFVRK